MPATRPNHSDSTSAAAAAAPRRRASSVAVPTTAVRLAHDFRPQKTRSNLAQRSDGRYNEPYSAIVEREDEVSVLCVQRTRQRQVLVRHMPEREWQRIVRHGEEIYPGQEGESSLHVVAAPHLSTLPRGFQVEATGPNAPMQPPAPTPVPAATAAAAEPTVFDYFVAPESRVNAISGRRKPSVLTALRLQVHLSHKAELQRVAREDCRAALSVERRNIFLRQYQRDMQCRMSGVSLYTVGKELPEQFVQTFFMLVENAQALRRHQERMQAANNGGTAARAQQQQQQRSGGRYLFTIDQATTNCGERLPFAGQAPADGFVVVTVGPTAEAFNAAWRPTSVAGGRFAWMDDAGDDAPFVPLNYGTAEYLPRPPTSRKEVHEPQQQQQVVDRLPGSSPLLPHFIERRAAKRGSGLSSASGTSPLGLSRSAVSSPSPFCAAAGSSATGMDERTTRSRTPSPLPLSSDNVDDVSSAETTPPPRAMQTRGVVTA